MVLVFSDIGSLYVFYPHHQLLIIIYNIHIMDYRYTYHPSIIVNTGAPYIRILHSMLEQIYWRLICRLWKFHSPMNPHVRVGRLVGRSVCHNFLKVHQGRNKCSDRSLGSETRNYDLTD